jgi:hypothetical protein
VEAKLTRDRAQRFDEVHDRLDRIEVTMSRIASALESANSRNATSPGRSSIRASPDGQAPRPTSLPMRNLPERVAKPAPRTLIPDKKGDMHYVGSTSLVSITNEAERIAGEKLQLDLLGKGASEQGQEDAYSAIKGLAKLSTNVSTLVPQDGYVELRMGGKGWWLPEKREESIRICNGG